MVIIGRLVFLVVCEISVEPHNKRYALDIIVTEYVSLEYLTRHLYLGVGNTLNRRERRKQLLLQQEPGILGFAVMSPTSAGSETNK